MKRILNFFNACDEVWIPQNHVEETVRKYGYKGPLTVVENGNDFASIIKDDVKTYKLEAKKRLTLNPRDLNLLFVGQHIWEKGLDTIINTLDLLKDNPHIRINFIGDGYASSEIEKMVQAKGLADKVTLHGLITSRQILSDFYAASDLFFFPSFYDNAPLVIREAAAMGTPSILLEGSTASEVIRDNYNGFLVNRNVSEIAANINRIEQDRADLLKIGINARNTLVRSWEDVVEEVSDRYETAIKMYR